MEEIIIPITDNNDSLNKKIDNMFNLQQSLIEMGFDLEMINKVINHFHVKSVNEAILYMEKTNGKWGHPFIPKELVNDTNNNNNNNLQSNPLTNQITLNTEKIFKKFTTNTNENEIICEICGESKEFHIINQNDNININFGNNNDMLLEDNMDNIQINNDKIKNELIERRKSVKIKENLNNKDSNNNINNDNNLIVTENMNEKVCEICMDELENPIQIEKCNHKFCQECLNEYLINKIKINDIEKISCPKNSCDNKALTEDFIFQHLNDEYILKYRTFKSQNEIAKNPNKIFCPLCDSYAEINKNENEVMINISTSLKDKLNSKVTLECVKNKHQFCSCGRKLHEGECYKDPKEVKNYFLQQNIKKCPKCGIYIKKDKGCNHMTCINPACKFEFCWLCMKESFPDHYNFGPCEGLQFVEENSFMFKLKKDHRSIYNFIICFKCLFWTIYTIACFGFPFLALFIIAFFATLDNGSPRFNYIKAGHSKAIMRVLYFFCICGAIIILIPLWYAITAVIYTIVIIKFLTSILSCFFIGRNNGEDENLIHQEGGL